MRPSVGNVLWSVAVGVLLAVAFVLFTLLYGPLHSHTPLFKLQNTPNRTVAVHTRAGGHAPEVHAAQASAPTVPGAALQDVHSVGLVENGRVVLAGTQPAGMDGARAESLLLQCDQQACNAPWGVCNTTSGTCVCDTAGSGFAGWDCRACTRTEVSACRGRGVLVDGGACGAHGPGTCACMFAWEGDRCDACSPYRDAECRDCAACADAPCGAHGTCVELSGCTGFRCECDPGYTGTLCDACADSMLAFPACTNLSLSDGAWNDAAASVCPHGRPQVNHAMQEVVACNAPPATGWLGPNADRCSPFLDPATCARPCAVCDNGTLSCGPNGTCVDADPFCTRARCVCADGWEGDRCDRPAGTPLSTCGDHGTLVNNDTCVCDGWWEGEQCDLCQFPRAIDPATGNCTRCAPCDQCEHGGTCALANDGCTLDAWHDNSTVVCAACDDHWTGSFCQLCPYPWDAASGCKDPLPQAERCARALPCSSLGRAGVPECTATPLPPASDFASWAGVHGSCARCRDLWSGPLCDTCAAPASVDPATGNCTQCALCDEHCPADRASACTPAGAAARCSPADRPQCVCRDGWAGPQCNQCLPPWQMNNATGECNECGSCDAAMCRGAASACRWSGPQCAVAQCVCDNPGAGGPLCDECLPGFWGPQCTPCNCTNTASPGLRCDDGRAGTGQCVCRDGWVGPQCTQHATCANQLWEEWYVANAGLRDGACRCAFGLSGSPCGSQCAFAQPQGTSASAFAPPHRCYTPAVALRWTEEHGFRMRRVLAANATLHVESVVAFRIYTDRVAGIPEPWTLASWADIPASAGRGAAALSLVLASSVDPRSTAIGTSDILWSSHWAPPAPNSMDDTPVQDALPFGTLPLSQCTLSSTYACYIYLYPLRELPKYGAGGVHTPAQVIKVYL